MKYIILKVIIIFFLFSFPLLFTDEGQQTKEISKPTEIEKKVRMLDNDEIVSLNLEDYILGVVACEMPASFNIEALKAQAVASRTYALNKMNSKTTYDLENSTNNQCYISKEQMKDKWQASYNLYYNKLLQAVNETKSEYLTYNGEIIKALYFSTSNGYTEDVESVFGEYLEYLVSVESSWDKDMSTYEREIIIDEEELINKLNIKDNRIKNIEIIDKSETGRINIIQINDQRIKGTDIRNLLGLRSTDFDMEFKNKKVYITTRGYGHGVGMSQYGSNGMANEGYKYDEILKYYYKNVEINSIN